MKYLEGVCEIECERGALDQTLSLCRDGVRVLNTLSFDSVCRGEGLEEFGVLEWSGLFLVGTPVMIPVVLCSAVNISISEQAQAMNNEQHYLVIKGLPTLGTVLGISTYSRTDIYLPWSLAADPANFVQLHQLSSLTSKLGDPEN